MAEQMIQVWPTGTDSHGMKHPHGSALRNGADGKPDPEGTPWPADQFTFRRLQDGSVTDKKPGAEEKKPEPEQAAAEATRDSRPSRS
jgi:hypothetical protein